MNAGLSYRKAAVAGASPVRLVILLYEQAMEDLRRALAALRRGDIEERTREINHAVLVLGHLEATLDKDQGGRVAANLERFYEQMRSGLAEAQRQQSAALVEQQISQLMLLHEAWCEVERELESAVAQPPLSSSSGASSSSPSSSEWSA